MGSHAIQSTTHYYSFLTRLVGWRFFIECTDVVNSLKGTNDRLAVAITKAEFSVLRTACSVSSLHFGSYVCYLFSLHGKDLLVSWSDNLSNWVNYVDWKVGGSNSGLWTQWVILKWFDRWIKINAMGQSSLQKVWNRKELFLSNLWSKLLIFFSCCFALCVCANSQVGVLVSCISLSFPFIF
jgi:hypothetical protein